MKRMACTTGISMVWNLVSRGRRRFTSSIQWRARALFGGKGGNFSRHDGNIGGVRESHGCGCLRDRLVLVAHIAEEQIDPGWSLNGSGLIFCKAELLGQRSLTGVDFAGVLPLAVRQRQPRLINQDPSQLERRGVF